jgi:hypothetical protein
MDTRVKSLEKQIRDYHHAFVVEKSIDSEGYREMVDRTRAELAVAKIERSDAQIDESDVEGVLTFAEHVIGHAAALWMNASAEDRLALQRAFFPDGLIWTRAGFGTAATCLAFRQIGKFSGSENGMASPRGLPAVGLQIGGRFRTAA